MKQNPLELYKEIAKVGAIMKEIKEMIKEDINAQGRDKSVSELLKSMSDLIDKGYLNSINEEKNVSKDTMIWLLFANMLLLIAMTAFIVNMHNSVLDLESKVFPTGRMFVEEVK